MKHAKIFSRVFSISGIILLCAMCSTVAYEYANMRWECKYFLTSAPPWVAFYLAIPFVIAIGICFTLHLFFEKIGQ